MSKQDAWRQQHELLEKFTTMVDVRADLRVTALACERTVRFSLGCPPNEHGRRHWHETQRNVGTMRELAKALNEACDFVEMSNPVWAEHIQVREEN